MMAVRNQPAHRARLSFFSDQRLQGSVTLNYSSKNIRKREIAHVDNRRLAKSGWIFRQDHDGGAFTKSLKIGCYFRDQSSKLNIVCIIGTFRRITDLKEAPRENGGSVITTAPHPLPAPIVSASQLPSTCAVSSFTSSTLK